MVSIVNAWSWKSRLGGALLCWSVGGCTEVLDIPADPQLVDMGPWRCLDEAAAAPVTTNAEQAQVVVQACDFITDCTTPVSGLSARLCDKRDVGCNSPRLRGITETAGVFRFPVPTAGGGFDGYLQVDSPLARCTETSAFGNVAGSVLCGLIAPLCDVAAPDDRCLVTRFAPAMLFFNPPVVHDVERPVSLQMFPSSGLPAIIAAAGIQLDPTAGSLFIQALDCDGKPAAGVRYELAPAAPGVNSLYVNNGVVSSSGTKTDESGIGGFVRVPPGFVSVIGYNSDSVPIGQIGVQSAASTLTYSALYPSR